MQEVRELASDWAAEDAPKRAGATMSVSIMLSMPTGTEPTNVRDAARQFAAETFGGRHDYVMALHTDVDHPHVHLSVRSLGEDGRRLNPRKADLARWRETFARTLRDRGVEAEATPRRIRGVIRKPLGLAARKLQDRNGRDQRAGGSTTGRERGYGTEALPEAIRVAQLETRRAYIQLARDLGASGDLTDHALALATLEFVRSMPTPKGRVTERLQDQPHRAPERER